jgi:single-stranded DNA-binding protein
MPSINNVFLAGYCDGDPRVMGESGNIVSFRLRMHEQGRKRGGEVFVKTEYVTVKAFGEAADFIGMNVSDGTGVLVQGKIRTERWGGPEARKKETLVVADRIQCTGSSEEQELQEMGVRPGTVDGEAQGSGEATPPGDQDHGSGGHQGPEHSEEQGAVRDPQQDQVASQVGEGSEAAETVAAGVQLPEAGTPEFEMLKGIQPVPW